MLFNNKTRIYLEHSDDISEKFPISKSKDNMNILCDRKYSFEYLSNCYVRDDDVKTVTDFCSINITI